MVLAKPEQVVGSGLVLRGWRESDLPDMVVLFDEAEIARRTPLDSPFTLESARARLLKAAQPDLLLLAITTDGVQPLGEVMVGAGGTMGYAVGTHYRGHGLAARAVTVLRDHAHAVLALPLLRLEIEPDNEASNAVARAAGFTCVPGAIRTGEDKGRPYALALWEHRA